MTMTLEEARGVAAQAWCAEPNKWKAMDVDLAESFARSLADKVNEAVKSAEFAAARRTMARHLADESLRIGYASNLAMLLHDRYGLRDYEVRNRAAEDILRLLFGDVQ